MWEKLKPYLLNIKTYVIAAIGILFILFKWEKGKRQDAESKLANAEYDKKDSVLKQEEKDNKARFEKEKAALEAEKGRKLSDQEMAEYLKKL